MNDNTLDCGAFSRDLNEDMAADLQPGQSVVVKPLAAMAPTNMAAHMNGAADIIMEGTPVTHTINLVTVGMEDPVRLGVLHWSPERLSGALIVDRSNRHKRWSVSYSWTYEDLQNLLRRSIKAARETVVAEPEAWLRQLDIMLGHSHQLRNHLEGMSTFLHATRATGHAPYTAPEAEAMEKELQQQAAWLKAMAYGAKMGPVREALTRLMQDHAGQHYTGCPAALAYGAMCTCLCGADGKTLHDWLRATSSDA